jgi:signal transduction histidine kinase
LALVYLVASAVIVGILVYRAYDTAASLNDRELSLRASDLGQFVTVDGSGKLHLELPLRLAAAYQAASGADVYAIRGADSRIIAALPESFGSRVADWPSPTADPTYFHLTGFGDRTEPYYGLALAVDTAAGPLAIFVARASGADALVHSLLYEFVVDLLWIVPVVMIVTMAVAIFAIRRGLSPIRKASQQASAIGPGSTSVRLPDTDLPSEITPLVSAMNRALDRLEQGFAIQRQFTANAAHELRTPLAIVTAALDAMDPNDELTKLKGDVARMNRLVHQLLRVARLDAVALDLSGVVDLNEAAASVVEVMAPWAIAQRRALALVGDERRVMVRGNAMAIEDAIRNLVENAVTHSPLGEEVVVSVSDNGTVSVCDRGAGVPVEDREHVFERFWRGKGVESAGAGLGLAIVREIMMAHGGLVTVADNAGSGATFTLVFPAQGDPESNARCLT